MDSAGLSVLSAGERQHEGGWLGPCAGGCEVRRVGRLPAAGCPPAALGQGGCQRVHARPERHHRCCRKTARPAADMAGQVHWGRTGSNAFMCLCCAGTKGRRDACPVCRKLGDSTLTAGACRGPACFDADFYVAANRFDLGWITELPDPHAAGLQHYLTNGIAEGRPARFTC